MVTKTNSMMAKEKKLILHNSMHRFTNKFNRKRNKLKVDTDDDGHEEVTDLQIRFKGQKSRTDLS